MELTDPGATRRDTMQRVRLVGLLTLISRILGYVRDAVMAAQFGRGALMDQFVTAFRLPNLFRQLFGEGALTTAFMPVFLRDLDQHGREVAFRTATAVFFATTVGLLGVVLAIEVVVLAVLAVTSLNYEAELLLRLFAILTPFLMLICVLAQACAVMQGLGEFRGPAQFPVFLNAVWIAVAWGLGLTSLSAESRIYWMSATIVLEGVCQLVLAAVTLKQLGFRFDLDWRGSRDRVQEIVRTMLPVLIGLSILQINTFCDSAFAWLFTAPEDGSAGWLTSYPLQAGTASDLYNAQRILQFPIGVFGTALGTVIYPLLTMHAERKQTDLFRADLTHGLRLVAAIAIPASVGLWWIAAPLTVVLFEHGAIKASDAQQTAAVVAMYALGVWSACGLLILQRGFYALGDRQTPMRLGLSMVGINLTLSLILLWPLGGRGLALSTSLSSILQCLITLRAINRAGHGVDYRHLLDGLGRTLLSTAALLGGCWGADCATAAIELPAGFIGELLRLLAPIILGSTSYAVAARLFKLPEPFELLSRNKRREP